MLAVASLLAVCAAGDADYAIGEWTVSQLTWNQYNDIGPLQVAGNRATWRGYDGHDLEIFLYDGTEVTQLTDNDLVDDRPMVSANGVAWHQNDGNDNEVMLYDGSGTIQLTDNNTFEDSVHMSNDRVIWRGKNETGVTDALYVYDGASSYMLTSGRVHGPRVSDGYAAWMLWGATDVDIYVKDFSQAGYHCVSNNSVLDWAMNMSGSRLVWQSGEEGDRDIFLHDAATDTTTQLTSTSWDEQEPRIGGDLAVWQSNEYGGGLEDIHLYDITTGTLHKLTENNGCADRAPEAGGGNVAWQRWDGNDWEIMVWDGETERQLTDNSYDDIEPIVSATTVLWSGWDGNDWEISAAYRTPEPAAWVLLLSTGVSGIIVRRRRGKP